MGEILEWADASDRHRDYCLWDYAPLVPPVGKLRQSSLLWNSFEALRAPAKLRKMVEALRSALGPFETVWGLKRLGQRFSWELYFYDYERLERRVSIERVLAILEPFAPSQLRLSPSRPYFMFSLDLTTDMAGIDQASVYMGNPGSSVSSGICYNLGRDGLRLDNLYYFFDAREQWDDIVSKVAASVHLDLRAVDLDDILWPELRACGVIVVANKRFGDGVYFSRITIDQLLHFVERLDYPEAVRRFLHDNRTRLDHLLYDVGIDYRQVDGRIEITKSAYYGIV